jgi:tRNA (guanosine-2'-O-)-methyltransferase
LKQLGSTDLKRLHREWRRRSVQRAGVILDRVVQPFNVGSILRTAAALRVEDVWFVGETPPPTHAKVGKTALGAERYLTTHLDLPSGADAVAAAQRAGYRVVAVELAEGAQPLHELPLDGDVCLVVGHEDRGITPVTLEACDAVGYVPQLGRIGSLNVATACSIALYELRRQSWQA